MSQPYGSTSGPLSQPWVHSQNSAHFQHLVQHWIGWLVWLMVWFICGLFGWLVGWLVGVVDGVVHLWVVWLVKGRVGCKSDAEEVVGLKYKLIGEGRKGFSWLHWTDFKPENHWGELHPCSLVDECWWYWKQKICRLFGPNCSSNLFMGYFSGLATLASDRGRNLLGC